MFKKILLLVTLSFVLSCSDFFNGKDSKQTPVDNPPPLGKNPFPKGFDPLAAPFTEEKMLATIGTTVIYPAAREFRLHLENLQLDVQNLAASLRRGTVDPLLEDAVRLGWKKAMLAFHFLDAAPVGPMVDRGRYLIDNIYSWPRFNPCGIDLEVVKLAHSGEGNPKLLFTLKGLNALEYLFFESSLGTRCNPNNPTHKPAFDWLAKTEMQRKSDRAAYADWIMQDLVNLSRTLEEAWNPEGANYSNTLINNAVYPSVKEATNAFSDAMFTIEEIKDRKLGRPLGLHKDCLTQKCPEMIEHDWSGLGIEGIAAHLRGLQAVYRGQRESAKGAYFGFDDFLVASNHSDVAQTMDQSLSAAIQTAMETASLGTLRAQIDAMDSAQCKATTPTNRLVPICALHQDIRQTIIKMKTELLTALSLRAPPKHQGDND